MAKIIFSVKTGEYREIDLKDAPRISIGRAPDNDIVINRRMASRKHALIEKRGEGYVLSDAGSFNGTFINRKRVKVHALQHKDVIQIADRVLVFLTKDADMSRDDNPDLVATAELEETVRTSQSPGARKQSSPIRIRERSPRKSPDPVEPPTADPENGFDFSLTPEDIQAFEKQ
jgi:pSer/pThr/pTyr-binding forkhead associated (FHA) protein